MRDIYLNALRVIAWVGDYAPFTKEEVDAAFKIASKMNERLLAEMEQVYLGEFENSDAVNVVNFSKAVNARMTQTYFDEGFVGENLSTLRILREILQRP